MNTPAKRVDYISYMQAEMVDQGDASREAAGTSRRHPPLDEDSGAPWISDLSSLYKAPSIIVSLGSAGDCRLNDVKFTSQFTAGCLRRGIQTRMRRH